MGHAIDPDVVLLAAGRPAIQWSITSRRATRQVRPSQSRATRRAAAGFMGSELTFAIVSRGRSSMGFPSWPLNQYSPCL